MKRVLLILLLAVSARADTILNSKHDLSVAGPGPLKAITETEVCSFCHTPHRALAQTPLWSHALSTATYIPYGSSTTKATIGQPTGSSKLCLSCHDGTVALGMVTTRATPIAFQNDVTTLPAGRSNLRTDLSDDHPVSFSYDSALVAANGQLKDPSTLTSRVRLDNNAQMQCTSCHDPHDNQFGKFLVQDNTASALCITCHSQTGWETSTHRTSAKTWNGTGVNPWPNTKETTVANNACESCHAPHNAGTGPRLLTFAGEEASCYACHNGNVAGKNIQSEFNKFSVHPVALAAGIHDPAEDPINSTRHVACADCHNPHASKSTAAIAPNASGALAGVTGINKDGAVVMPLTREYESCFRCHADSGNRGPARVTRQFVETNTRLEFAANNASYHPILAAGKNPSVPSLISPMTPASLMYCTDCHNNNQGPGAGGTGPKGPHGSIYSPILERRLETTDFQDENATIYALCYKCHDRTSILSDQSFPEHHKHISDVKTACTTCHDPHGVISKPKLINFNTTYVTPSSNGRLEFNSTGARTGNCSLTCHGKDHNSLNYAP